MRFLLIIAFLISLNTGCYSQKREVAGSNLFGYRIGDYYSETYNVVRTDENGEVIWVKPVIVDKSGTFDLSESKYIIYGFTKVKNGKITGKPEDYDYWLVRSDTAYDVDVYPNPNTGNFYVALSNYKEGIVISLYDIQNKLVFTREITQYVNFFILPYLQNGIYIYIISDKEKPIKFGKLCVLQNY